MLYKVLKNSWERRHCPSTFFCQGSTLNDVQHSENIITVLWQCVNHGNEIFSVSRIICVRNQALLIPGVTQSLMTKPYLRLGWNTTDELVWLREISERRLGQVAPSYFLSVQKIQYLNEKQTGGRTIQCNIKSEFEFSCIEIWQPESWYTGTSKIAADLLMYLLAHFII